MSYIKDDEVLEVTRMNLRLRKKYLDPHERKELLSYELRILFSLS